MDLAERLAEAADPVVRYRARRYLLGDDDATLRAAVADSALSRSLVGDLVASDPRDRDGLSTIYLTLRYLADIDHPAGDERLLPYRDVVHAWLQRSPVPFVRGTHRVHGSFHANAIHADVVLGLANDATDELAADLLRYQWPGGGWNCNKKPATKGPSIVHTAYGLRGLVTYRTRRPSDELDAAIDAAAEVLLERRVHLRRTTGEPLRPVFTKPSYPYPRLYDVGAGLHILTRAGRVTDPRCTAALDLLASKQGPDGWVTERTADTRWPPATANALLTVDALEILRAAGRG